VAAQNPSEERSFVCRYATNAMKGLYYEFNWTSHRLSAQGHTMQHNDWVTGSEWNVQVEQSSRTPASSPSKHGRRARGGQESDDELLRGSKTPAKRVSKRDKATFSERFITTGLPTPSDHDYDTKGKDSASDADSDGKDGNYISSSEEEASDDELRLEALSEPESDAEDEEYDEPKTPSRKRKRGRLPKAQPTPHTKRRLKDKAQADSVKSASKSPRKQKLKFASDDNDECDILASPSKSPSKSPRKSKSPSKKKGRAVGAHHTFGNSAQAAMIAKLPKDPWVRAMHVMHVGMRCVHPF
jgi:origin recognition complex subunit 1